MVIRIERNRVSIGTPIGGIVQFAGRALRNRNGGLRYGTVTTGPPHERPTAPCRRHQIKCRRLNRVGRNMTGPCRSILQRIMDRIRNRIPIGRIRQVLGCSRCRERTGLHIDGLVRDG